MKHTFSKKLVLKRATVYNLNADEMNAVNGGLTWTDPRACNTNYQCSIYYTIAYTCVAGCPPCPGTAVPKDDET